MTLDHGEREPAGAMLVAAPAAMAVLTWSVLMVLVGVLLQFRPVSATSALELLAMGVMVWPLLAFRPWRDGVTDRLRSWAVRSKPQLALTAGLLATAALVAEFAGPPSLATVLDLPAEVLGGGLFGMTRFYRVHVGTTFARLLSGFARLYFDAVWLYLVASAVRNLLTTAMRGGG